MGSVTNRSGSEWPLCEYNFSYLSSCTELFIEHYVMHFSGLPLIVAYGSDDIRW